MLSDTNKLSEMGQTLRFAAPCLSEMPEGSVYLTPFPSFPQLVAGSQWGGSGPFPPPGLEIEPGVVFVTEQ